MKVLDWSKTADVNFDDKRRKAQGLLTCKELFQKAYKQLQEQEQTEALIKAKEPILKERLLAAMLTKTPITVTKSFNNPTETIGGLSKSEDDDGFYQSASSKQSENAQFKITMETVPAGEELVFKSWLKTLGQFIFKGKSGREYAIYEKSDIIYNDRVIKNPGLFGLLFNTNLNENLE